MSPRPSLSLNLFPNPTFKFELTKLPQAPPARVSPITIKTIDNTAQLGNSNPSKCSDRPSPSSSNALSFNSSSAQISPSISTREPSITKDTLHRQSAFQPYSNQSNFLKKIYPLTKNETVLTPYNMQTTAAPISTDVHAAQVETIVSNLGKSKQGHLCIYCGKVYSRKYGLKIHIRSVYRSEFRFIQYLTYALQVFDFLLKGIILYFRRISYRKVHHEKYSWKILPNFAFFLFTEPIPVTNP